MLLAREDPWADINRAYETKKVVDTANYGFILALVSRVIFLELLRATIRLISFF